VIFRKVALERLSSPEQLDQLMQVTNPKGWLALAALGGLILAALAWGIYGSIPTEAVGEGILIRQGGIAELTAPAGGQIGEVTCAIGDVIKKGQVVATILQESLNLQIRNANSKLKDLRSELQAASQTTQEQMRLQERDLAQQRANLARSIGAGKQQQKLLAERVEAQQKLLADGLITKQTLLATQEQLNTARDQTASLELQASGLDLKRIETRQQLAGDLLAKQRAVADMQAQIRELNAKLAEEVSVPSPFSGRVLELMVHAGDRVGAGNTILSLEILSEELEAVIFVPAASGKQVRRGMTVRVAPSTVKKEEYGYIIGRVSWVAEFPSTARGMMRLLANEGLVNRLTVDGPPIQVNVGLLRDPATPTGFKWSSSAGPSLKIGSGTLAEGSVTVKEDRPINLVIPTVREKLGI
jgi:HlyD family secretion protein